MLTLRIESETRWDALALAHKLAHYRWFLVEPDSEHWDVYVPLDADPTDDLPGDLLQRIVEWLDERDLEEATIHTPATDVVLTRE